MLKAWVQSFHGQDRVCFFLNYSKPRWRYLLLMRKSLRSRINKEIFSTDHAGTTVYLQAKEKEINLGIDFILFTKINPK